MSSSDSTLVTGSPFAAGGPQKGSVLGERWEVRDLEEADALFLTLRAVDQESDGIVLMRAVAPGLLGDTEARKMAQRLKRLVGKGGPTLNPLRDVDREGATLFSVEPYPTGASFRSVLEARRQKGQTLTPAELLPVVARIEAALAGIPEPFFHGDLRPQRIFVAPERVLLTGGFFLSALPGDPLVDALARDIPLRRQFAPEVGDGLAGRPSDRWAVAALVWEALVGAPPQPGPRTAPPKLGALGPVLSRYLDPDPAHRPTSLGSLLESLAAVAGVPIPPSAPERFEVEPEEGSEGTDPNGGVTIAVSRDSLERGSMEPLAGSGTEPRVNDTQKLPALADDGAPAPKPKRDLEGIDPALLQAAAASRKISDSGTFELDGQELEKLDTGKARVGRGDGKTAAPKSTGKPADKAKSKAPGADDLDPRLVRAALAADSDPTIEDLVPEPTPAPVPAKAKIAAPKKAAGVTQELDAADLVSVGGAKPASAKVAPKAAAPKAALSKAQPIAKAAEARPAPRASDPPRASAPAAAAPKPAARTSSPGPAPARAPAPAPAPRISSPGPSAPSPGPVRSSVPTPAPAPRPSQAPAQTAPRAAPGPAASGFAAPAAGTYPAPPAVRRPPSAGPSGTTIVALAVLLGLLIVGAALAYRHFQNEAAREHRIDERLRELGHH